MNIDITIKNYRCFSDQSPARFRLTEGFTALLGLNNAGKSALLKFFFEFRHLFQTHAAAGGHWIRSILHEVQAIDFPRTILDLNELFHNSNNRDIELTFRMNPRPSAANATVPDELVALIPRASNQVRVQLFAGGERLGGTAGGASMEGSVISYNSNNRVDVGQMMEMFANIASTVYIGASRNAINIGAQENYFDISVGTAFIKTWRAWKTGNNKKQNEHIDKLTDDIRRIFGFQSLEINASLDEATLKFIIDKKSFALGELGTGVAQFLVVLGNVATQTPSFVLIDEPEINLHPSLQIDFLTTLASYAKNGVLFATHSYGLLTAAPPIACGQMSAYNGL